MTDDKLVQGQQRLYPTVEEDQEFNRLKKLLGLKDSTTASRPSDRFKDLPGSGNHKAA